MLRLLAFALLGTGAALGFLLGWRAPLGEALFRYDPAFLNTAQAVIQRYVSPALWDDGVLPLLERPSWLLPAVVGALLLAAHALLPLLRAGRRRRRDGASV